MTRSQSTGIVLMALTAAFLFLAVGFSLNLWGKPTPVRQIPLVDPRFLNTDTWRRSYADLIKAGEDVEQFDCYICHDEDQRLELKFDPANRLVIPEEHSDIVMGHGSHGRNDNCFNCHNDENLRLLQTRDGRELKLANSTPLCGSCHGPTYRDWESGSHGRTNGYWDRSLGPFTKQNCVNCHDPHSPKFPGRKPAPPPNYLRKPTSGQESPHTGH